MFVVTSSLRVVAGSADDLAAQYARRGRLVEDVPGCLGVEILRHAERRDEFVVYMRWRDREAYDAYRTHPAFRQSHQRMREIPGVLKVAPDRAVDCYEVLS